MTDKDAQAPSQAARILNLLRIAEADVPQTSPDKKPQEPSEAQDNLSRDLGELYQDLLHRTAKVTGNEAEPVKWSSDNPFAHLSQPVRETLQAGAALHYEELVELRKVAERALHDWQVTQPQLLTELAKLQHLPTLHRQAIAPLLGELVKRGLLPEVVLTYAQTAVEVGANNWTDAFPSLLAANAAAAPNISHKAAEVVLETLVEGLLSEADRYPCHLKKQRTIAVTVAAEK